LRDIQIFIFSYGCVVFYGVSENGERAVMSALRHYEAGRLSIRDSRSDSFNYQYMDWKENETPLLRVLEDTVLIANAPEDELVLNVKLAAAHAVAQNAKLGSYENAIDLISARVMHIPGVLATTGSLNLSDRDILKLQGELFSLVSHISISTRIQNIPDWYGCSSFFRALLTGRSTGRQPGLHLSQFVPGFVFSATYPLTTLVSYILGGLRYFARFWEREHLEPVFVCMHRYLNMEQRLGLLNSRMDRLQEMYDLFRDVRQSSNAWIQLFSISIPLLFHSSAVVRRIPQAWLTPLPPCKPSSRVRAGSNDGARPPSGVDCDLSHFFRDCFEYS
jgi:uncharacterized Rmd1/YagE family protein